MRLIAISSGNPPDQVYLIWEIPHDRDIMYGIYRDDVLIAGGFDPNKDTNDIFVHPTLFDHDHGTNLFKKDSTFKLMYTDEVVSRYQHYNYKVVAKVVDANGNVLETITSNEVIIQAL